jgi:hypothetical protein
VPALGVEGGAGREGWSCLRQYGNSHLSSCAPPARGSSLRRAALWRLRVHAGIRCCRRRRAVKRVWLVFDRLVFLKEGLVGCRVVGVWL